MWPHKNLGHTLETSKASERFSFMGIIGNRLQKAALLLGVIVSEAEQLIAHQAQNGQVAETLSGTQQTKGSGR